MKKIIFASLLVCLSAQAQTLSKKELVQRSIERLFPDGETRDKNANMSDIVVEWNKVFDAQNLERDKNQHRMDWKTLFPIRQARTHEISGKRIYYHVVPKKYNYRVIEDPKSNSLIVNIKIHFYPSKTYLKRVGTHKDVELYPEVSELMRIVKTNLAEAELVWNDQAPKGVKYRFEMVDKATQSDYSIKLTAGFGALYDKFIMAPAYTSTLVHELGHMMGLDEEYAVVTSNALSIHSGMELVTGSKRHVDYSMYKDMRCNLESIMCLRETVYPYHVDHILGRIEL